jgi:hypothetical protein
VDVVAFGGQQPLQLRRKRFRGADALPRNIAGAERDDLRLGIRREAERAEARNCECKRDRASYSSTPTLDIHGVPLLRLPVVERRHACQFAACRAALLSADYRL